MRTKRKQCRNAINISSTETRFQILTKIFEVSMFKKNSGYFAIAEYIISRHIFRCTFRVYLVFYGCKLFLTSYVDLKIRKSVNFLCFFQFYSPQRSSKYSVVQGISLSLKYCPSPPPPTTKRICQTYLFEQPSQNFGELDSPPSLKCILVQKRKDLLLKGRKDFISNNEMRSHLNLEIGIYSCKI